MLAESIHSVADSGNQLLLLIGGRRASRAATPEHPFGYGRQRYVYAFLVSIVLFSVGGLFAIYEGVHKWQHPEPIEGRWWWVPIVVLLVAIGLESYSFRTAVHESNRTRGRQSWVQYVRTAKAPELPVVLLEDTAALLASSSRCSVSCSRSSPTTAGGTPSARCSSGSCSSLSRSSSASR